MKSILGQGTVRNVDNANQPKGSYFKSEGSNLEDSGLLLEVSCHLLTSTFLVQAPVPLPPVTPESTVDSLVCPEELKNVSEERR